MPYAAAGASRLYYEAWGEGPPLVLAHGVGGNHASWFNQVPTFSKRYRTIVVDHRAFGNSTDEEGQGRSAYVEDLARVLDEVGVERAFLVGQSMGGGACAAFACRFPERVMGLVHADSLAGVTLPAPHGEALERVNASTWNLSQAERVLGPVIRAEDPERTFLYLQIASFNSVSLKTVKGRPEPWSPAGLAAAKVPVLFVVGEHDVICPPDLIRVLHEAVPGSRMAVIPAAGHSAYFEAHAAFNACVLDYLAGLLAGAP
jgi:pimeloyl-ACP methyl ester carboxylesterase